MHFGAAALTLFAVSAYVGEAAPQQPNFLVLVAGDPHETNPLVLDELSDSERRNHDELKRIYAELLASEDAEAVGR